MGMTFPAPQTQLSLAGVLTATPTGATPAGLYTQTSGTPPSGIALGDIFSWSGSAAILYRSFVNAPSAVTVSGTTWAKVSGTWIALSAPTGAARISSSVTIGATVSAPAKPTSPTVDHITIIDDGSGWCDLQMMLSAESTAGSTSGNGIYLFLLPGGYKFDAATHPPNPNTATQVASYQEVCRMIPGSKGFVGRSDNTYSDLVASPYDATRFFIFIPFDWEKVRSNWYQLGVGFSGIGYQIAFKFKKG